MAVAAEVAMEAAVAEVTMEAAVAKEVAAQEAAESSAIGMAAEMVPKLAETTALLTTVQKRTALEQNCAQMIALENIFPMVTNFLMFG